MSKLLQRLCYPLKIVTMKVYDIIERVQAPWFVELDESKVQGFIDIFRNKKERILKAPGIKEHYKKTLIDDIDDLILSTQILKSGHVIKLREVKVMSKQEANAINSEVDTIDDFAEQKII